MTDIHKASSVFFQFPEPFIHIASKETLDNMLKRNPNASFTAVSSPFAGCSLGIAWWESLIKDYPHIPSILDCGASMALAVQALHDSVEGVVCRHFSISCSSLWKERIFLSRPTTIETKEFFQ